jgi:hypothetical protein
VNTEDRSSLSGSRIPYSPTGIWLATRLPLMKSVKIYEMHRLISAQRFRTNHKALADASSHANHTNQGKGEKRKLGPRGKKAAVRGKEELADWPVTHWCCPHGQHHSP